LKVFLSSKAFSDISSRLPNRRESSKNLIARHNSLKNLKKTEKEDIAHEFDYLQTRNKPNIPIPNKNPTKRETTLFGFPKKRKIKLIEVLK
jgi:hypothetical protein